MGQKNKELFHRFHSLNKRKTVRSITQEGLFLKKNYGKQHFRPVLTVFHGLLPIFGASFFKSSNFADLPISSYLTLLVLVLVLSFPVIPPSAFPAGVITASSCSSCFPPPSGGRRRRPGFGSLLEAEDDAAGKRRSRRTWRWGEF